MGVLTCLLLHYLSVSFFFLVCLQNINYINYYRPPSYQNKVLECDVTLNLEGQNVNAYALKTL